MHTLLGAIRIGRVLTHSGTVVHWEFESKECSFGDKTQGLGHS